jgi:hypothetical protein
MAVESSTLKPLVESYELTNGAVTVYTVPASTKAVITGISVFNDSGSNQTFYMYLVASGDSVALENKRYEQTIYAKGTFNIDCRHMLNAGGTIQVLASANSVMSLQVTGFEIVEVV